MSRRISRLFICGPATQIGLYIGANSPGPPPRVGIEPFTNATLSSRQYVLRTSSRSRSGTYSQIPSGSLMWASQSNTGKVFEMGVFEMGVFEMEVFEIMSRSSLPRHHQPGI